MNILKCFFIVVHLFCITTSCSNSGPEKISLIPLRKGYDFEFINGAGETVIDPQFREASIFRNGRALVKTSGEGAAWGFIDENGTFEIAAQYVDATIFSEGVAWVVPKAKSPLAITKTGTELFSLEPAEKVRIFKDGVAAFSVLNENTWETWGFVDKEGNIIIEPNFQEVRSFSEGLCMVRNENDECGFINKSGELVIDYLFHHAKDFKDGKAVAFQDGKAGVINTKGEYIIQPQFSDMIIDGNKFLVSQNRKWGWINLDGNIIIEPQYSEAYPFYENDLALVEIERKWGFIDADGMLKINPQFDLALPFVGNNAIVAIGKKVGVIDHKGSYILNPEFDNVSVDLTHYSRERKSLYEQVTSDFFDAQKIANSVQLEELEGLSLNYTYDEIKRKLGKPEKTYQYDDAVFLIKDRKITNNAYLSFLVGGESFRKYRIPGNAKPNAFLYHIDLRRNGIDKGAILIEAFQNQLEGYTRNNDKSTDIEHWFFKDDIEIGFREEYNMVKIIIKKPEVS